MKLQRSLVLKSCCWFPQQLSGSIGAHLSGYSHNTKHGCTLYNNLDCLLYLRVETDYIIQLGRMCREVFVFFMFIQGLPHKNQFNDIVNVLGVSPPKPDALFFLQLCSFTRLLNGNAGTLDASFFNNLWKFNQKQESKYNTPVCAQQGVVQSSPAAVQ